MLLRAILPDAVALEEMDPAEAQADALLPAERAEVARAVPRRQREYAAGRILAAKLLGERGAPRLPLLAGPDRAPIWPAGFVGSIAHCERLAVVAIASLAQVRGLGLDVEPALPLPEGVAERVIFAPDRLWAPLGPVAARLAFCAKEAAYKAIYPITRQFLDFDAMILDFGHDTFRATLAVDAAPFPAGTTLQGRWTTDGVHLGAAVLLEPEAPLPISRTRRR